MLHKTEYLFGKMAVLPYLCSEMEKTVLCINGSDSMGHSGLQADIRTLRDLGSYGVTAVTSVTVQNAMGITDVYELPSELVVGQVRAIYEEVRPHVVKVGMINNPQTIAEIRDEIVGCPRIVCSPVILSSYGGLLMDRDSIRSYCQHLLPICTLLIVKCTDAEIMLGTRISTDGDMQQAAERLRTLGAEWVLLRGGTYTKGRINALLSGKDCSRFFSSVNVEGWQRHGVGGTLSTAIAARLAQGDDMQQAVSAAHGYLHCQVVYTAPRQNAIQPNMLYDKFMSHLSDNYTAAHDVAFYANALSITTRYLSQITNSICGRSPKQIIDGYLIRESELLLQSTSLSIQQIAIQLGFSSQIAFAKFFKVHKGCSPTSFRNATIPQTTQ